MKRYLFSEKTKTKKERKKETNKQTKKKIPWLHYFSDSCSYLITKTISLVSYGKSDEKLYNRWLIKSHYL